MYRSPSLFYLRQIIDKLLLPDEIIFINYFLVKPVFTVILLSSAPVPTQDLAGS